MSNQFSIGLHHAKTSANIGGVLRATDCYRGSMVAITGQRYKKASTDTLKTYRRIPLIQVEDLKSFIPFGATPIAIDLVEGAVPLMDFKHPKNAYYIFGAEDGTLGKDVLDWCPYKVMVPTRFCMNLAACVNVVLYDRMTKLTSSVV